MPGGSSNKLAIILAVVAIILGGVFVYRLATGGPVDSVEHLSSDITIVDSQNGDEWTMNRGRLEQQLYMRSGMINPNEGLANPNTGTPTGFPKNREREWDAVIERINAEKSSVKSRGT